MITVKFFRAEVPGVDRMRVMFGDHGAIKRALAAGLYVDVAEFDGDDPEELFRITQNGVDRESWSLTPPAGLHPVPGAVGEHGLRSMMVGDVLVSDGQVYACDLFGFSPL